VQVTQADGKEKYPRSEEDEDDMSVVHRTPEERAAAAAATPAPPAKATSAQAEGDVEQAKGDESTVNQGAAAVDAGSAETPVPVTVEHLLPEQKEGVAAFSAGCVSFRQTGGCNPDGPFEQTRDCGEVIHYGISGYCQCEGHIVAGQVTCSHHPFSCKEACARANDLKVKKVKNKATSQLSVIGYNSVPRAVYPPRQPGQSIHSDVLKLMAGASIFKELRHDNVPQFINSGKPLVIFLLCNCERDDDWHINEIETELMERSLDQTFTFAYCQSIIVEHFQLIPTFGLTQAPALVIDNIPMGANNEKYVFNPSQFGDSQDNIYSRKEGWGQGPSAKAFADFLEGFTLHTIPLVVRSRPAPPPRPLDERGVVWDIVGSTFQELVIKLDRDVLMMFYSPRCPGSIALLPIFGEVARTLGLQTQSNILLARMDLTVNDLPVRGIRVQMYPTLYFFPRNNKQSPINYQEFGHMHTHDGIPLHTHFDREGIMSFLARYSSTTLALPAEMTEHGHAEHAGHRH